MPSPVENANEPFWKAVLDDLAFDDGEHAVLPFPPSSVYVLVEGSGRRDWGLTFVGYLHRSRSRIGVYLTWRKGFQECERVFDEIVCALDGTREQGIALDDWEQWSNSEGRPRLGFKRRVNLVDGGDIRDFDEAVEWMRDHFSRLVSALYPECRRRLRPKR